MDEKIKNTKTYSETDRIPSEYPYADMIKTAPYMPDKLPLHIGPYKKHSGSASNKPLYKTVGFNQNGSRFMTKEEYDNFNLDEEEPYDFTERLMRRGDFRPSSSYPSYPQYSKWKQFLSNVTRQPYRAATSAAGGYNVSQLNQMNALGGYYSEPARQQRRMDARRTNILNRAAKGKAVGNVNQLLGKYGYTGTPGSGTLQFTGQAQGDPNAGAGYSRSDDSWSSSPFRRGGLASLWQR
jgi:hypothetical protein